MRFPLLKNKMQNPPVALCHLSADINLANCLAGQSPYVHAMESGPAMRLRTQIELLAALILTLAALVAISKVAKATGMNDENTYGCAIVGQTKTGVT